MKSIVSRCSCGPKGGAVGLVSSHHRAAEITYLHDDYNLMCFACGEAWAGTLDELSLAQKQDRAHMRRLAREEREAAKKQKAADTLAAYQRNMRDGA